MIYADVFEAVRAFEPSSTFLYLKDREGQGVLQRQLSFEALRMPNEKILIMPRTGMNVRFYRGQAKDYPQAIPSIYRSATKASILIDRLKIIDFELVTDQFPQIYRANKANLQIDMLALAQHYELRTDMLDLTSDISVAAFFATTKKDAKTNAYQPIQDGIGSISSFFYLTPCPEENGPFRFVGLQPFLRPGRQCAFGIRLEEGQSLESIQRGAKILFRQNARYGQKLIDLYGAEAHNELFPEELIADVARKIRGEHAVTEAAIEIYCKRFGEEREDVEKLLLENGVTIEEKSPIFRLTRKEHERQCV